MRLRFVLGMLLVGLMTPGVRRHEQRYGRSEADRLGQPLDAHVG